MLINLQQGSQAWHDYRLCHIMATDASIIMEVNPFKSPDKLWEEKLGFCPPEIINKAMMRGNELEPIVRELFNESHNIPMNAAVCESDNYPWMAASLDGISPDGELIIEIKCPNQDTHNLALDGQIKPYYFCQMQHQLFCTQAKKCIYLSYRPESNNKKLIELEVYPHVEYIAMMIEKEKEFWHLLNTFQKPRAWTLPNAIAC